MTSEISWAGVAMVLTPTGTGTVSGAVSNILPYRYTVTSRAVHEAFPQNPRYI